MSFVSLHNHTEVGSPLDGMNKVSELFERAKEVKMPGVAVTEHGYMNSLYDSYKESQKTGIKLVPGLEAYFAPDLSTGDNRHLVLLAKNATGYKNLLRMNYESFKNPWSGFMGKITPRISWEHLEKYNEGVFCLTACSNGLVAKSLITGNNEEEALCHIDRLHSIFNDRFYLEIQPHALFAIDKKGREVNQPKLNEALIRISHDRKIPYVITCDAHYKDKEHAKYHDFMLAIKDKKPLDDPDRFRYGVQDMYLKDQEEIVDFFGSEIAEKGMKSSMDIFNACDEPHYLKPVGTILPKFPIKQEAQYDEFVEWKTKNVPNLEDDKAYFRFKVQKGFREKCKDFSKEQKNIYWNRVKSELEVIELRNFSSYMLIVSDYMSWAKKSMLVGPARGCLSGTSKISTPNGLKEIKSLKIGDEVYDETGAIIAISDVHKYACKEKLLKIKSYYGGSNEISLTSDHKVLVSKAVRETNKRKIAGGSVYAKEITPPKWIRADEIEPGDLLVKPKLKVREDSSPFFIKENIYKRASNNSGIKTHARIAGIGQTAIRTFIKNDGKNLKNRKPSLKFQNYLKANNLTYKEVRDSGFKTTSVPSYIEKNYDAGYMFGLWISDGWMIKSKKDTVVGFCCKKSDDNGYVTNALKKVFGDIPISVADHASKDVRQFNISHHGVRKLFRDLFPDYNFTSKTKYIPDELLNSPEDFRLGLRDGLWAGDGTHKGRTVYASSSIRLAENIKLLLDSLGNMSSLTSQLRKEKREKFGGDHIEYKVTSNRYFNSNKHQFGVSFDGRFSYMRVTEVSVVKNEEEFVYDITVPTTHSYMAESFIVHNSAAGSLCAFFADITTVDPLKYDLLFERFQNKEKKSLPDIDSDFADPEAVKKYLASKYGEDKVASVSNWSTLSPKVIIKDSARTLNIGGDKSTAFQISNHITSVFPEVDSIDEAIRISEPIREYSETYPELFKYARKLEGLTRNWSMHAAAVVISDQPLYELVPLRIEDGLLTTQWEKSRCEEFGLVKMDLLGINTLRLISATIKTIKEHKGIDVDFYNIPLDDPATYKTIGDGHNIGVFQLEMSLSPYCFRLKPKNIEEISDINALGRPSCLAAERESYINRKLGLEPITFDHPNLTRALQKTKGVLLYEESAMMIAQDVAGWDLNRADALRKLSKEKDPSKAEAIRGGFIADCMSFSGLSYEQATNMFEKYVVPLSGYSFNKSHSVSYSILSYITAWLKTHYPIEYMTELLNSEDPNSDKSQEYLVECKRMGFTITPPLVNKAGDNYKIVNDTSIATGFSAIKGIGENAILELVNKRPFVSYLDLLYRCESRVINKRVIQGLAKAGAIDEFGYSRKLIYDSYEYARKTMTAKKAKIAYAEDEITQGSWNAMLGLTKGTEEWSKKDLLLNEREVLGRTVSGSLHEVYKDFFTNSSMITPLSRVQSVKLKHAKDRVKIKIEVIIKSLVKEIKIKTGKNIGRKFGKYLVEDIHGTIMELTVWADDFDQYRPIFKDGMPIKAICEVQEYMGQKTISLSELERRAI